MGLGRVKTQASAGHVEVSRTKWCITESNRAVKEDFKHAQIAADREGQVPRNRRTICRIIQQPVRALDQLVWNRRAHQASQRQARARTDSIVERRPLIGSELVFVRCSLPFRVTAPRYCSPSTPVDKAGPQIAVSSISRARVGYGIAPTLDNEPCDAKWACMK